MRSVALPPETDALLVTRLHNIRYLTGFTGSNAMLLLLGGTRAVLYTDPRYTVQSKQQADCAIKIATGGLGKAALKDIRRRRIVKLGFEQDHLTYAQYESLKKELPLSAELVPLSGFIEKLRTVKDYAEIALIRASVDTNSKALANALKRLKPGISEADFAAEIDYQNRRLGAAKIAPGMLLIDMGAFRDGYASDMTRMIHLGPATTKYKKAYKAVLEAQLAAIDAIRPGAKTSAVDKAARDVLKAHGLEKEFIHSTGHGLGLEIHEPPRIGRKDKTKLEEGMAITVEPGVYIEGWGGIRIEDTVLVTATGCEILTPTGKELREL